MPELPGHDRREARRAKRHGRRYVRSGEEFTSDELEAGTVELEEREPSDPEQEEFGYEPWARDGSKGERDFDKERLRLYREFVESRMAEDPDYRVEREGNHGDDS
jgi:hypothetical protein